jgi:hypothetical protein
MDMALDDLGKRWVPQARSSQNYVMTGMNNLGVMLSEALKDMQDAMNNSSSGASCKKPKSGKPKQSMGQMKQQQDQINRMIEELKKKQQGGNKPQDGGQGGNKLSKEYAQIAAQQEMLRRQLEQLQKMMQKDGNAGKLGDMNKTQQLMDDVEKDLVNKNITEQTLKRLKEIEVRMLDHEKAEREQELDKERKGETGQQKDRKIPPALEEYLKEKNREVELLQSLPPSIKPYYKDKVKEYYRLLNE